MFEIQANIHKDIVGKYDDMKTEVIRKDNRIMVTALYGYTDETGEGRIKDRLTYLMEKSRRIIFETMKHREKALESVRKDLEKQKPSQLVNGDLIVNCDWWFKTLLLSVSYIGLFMVFNLTTGIIISPQPATLDTPVNSGYIWLWF